MLCHNRINALTKNSLFSKHKITYQQKYKRFFNENVSEIIVLIDRMLYYANDKCKCVYNQLFIYPFFIAAHTTFK